ncbi:hypothetical protein HHI36_018357 [Cryptolaemus montrouzieri]|uniref:Uncharacterized protein n=1 Tax=Cryptolaemus montrouzieri TaxID=559131 RepID=A0ABD2NZX1_9CUCU
MEVSLEKGIRKFVFNRPQKRNAITLETYETLTQILNKDANNDNVIVTIITARENFFSSGNDFKCSLMNPEVDHTDIVKNMLDTLIKYPKILVAVVNGPAIGIAATLITLCDIIYCSDRATFEIPFIRLGLSMEGCSSYIYSHVLGKSKAAEMLFFNHILTAKEAYRLGFVADIIPHEKLVEFIESLYRFGSLPLKSVVRNKELFTRWSRHALLKCNEEETEVLKESLESEEFLHTVTSMLQKKSKL